MPNAHQGKRFDDSNILLTVAEMFRQQGEYNVKTNQFVMLLSLYIFLKSSPLYIFCFSLGKLAWLLAEKTEYISHHLNDIEESKCTVDDIDLGSIHAIKTMDQKAKLQALADLATATQEALQEVQVSKTLIEAYRNNLELNPTIGENHDKRIFSLSTNKQHQSSSDSSTNSTEEDRGQEDKRYSSEYLLSQETSKVKVRERDFDSSDDEKPVSKISRRERDWDDSSMDENIKHKAIPIIRERDISSSEDED